MSMKKSINLFIVGVLLMLFGISGFSQTVIHTFVKDSTQATGYDSDPTVAELNFQLDPSYVIDSIVVDASIGNNCPSWYSMDININGGIEESGVCNGIYVIHSLDGQNGFNNIISKVESIDEDAYDDYVSVSNKTTIYYSYTVYDTNVAVIEIVSPVSSFTLSSSESISVNITNKGLDTISNFPIRYSIDGGNSWTEEVYNGALAPGDTANYVFNTSADFSQPGIYNVVVELPISNDGYYGDNILYKEIAHTMLISDYYKSFDFETSDYLGYLYLESTGNVSWNVALISDIPSGNFSNLNNNSTYCFMADGTEGNGADASFILGVIKQADSTTLSFESQFQDYAGNGDAYVYMSNDGMNTWTEVFNETNDENYGGELHVLVIPGAVNDTVYFKFRYSANASDAWQWAVDNVTIKNIPDVDLVVNNVSVIGSLCVPSTDTVQIEVSNAGALPQWGFTISYTLDGNTWYTDTIGDTLQPGETVAYTFTDLYAFTSPGNYVLTARVEQDGDTVYVNNNEMTINLFKQPIITSYPYYQDFEGSQYWFSDGDLNNWELATPAGNDITSAASGNLAWITGASSYYEDDELAYVESPCFDFSSLTAPIVQFDLNVAAENNWDGVYVKYTINDTDWVTLGEYGDWLNWYNDNSVGGEPGWSYNTNGWITVKHEVFALAGQPHVKFRVYFDADGSYHDYDGAAFDNFKVYDAEYTLALTEISYNPPEGGTDSLEYMEFYNYGNEPVNLNGIYFLGDNPVQDTFPAMPLYPGEFFVTAVDSEALANTTGYTGAHQWISGGLSNGGEDIILVNPSGDTIVYIIYDDAAPWNTAADGYGPSLVFCPMDIQMGLDPNDGSNWKVSTMFIDTVNGIAMYGSPGAIDGACTDIALVMPENGAHYYDCDLTATDTVEIVLTNVGGVTIPAGDTIFAGYQVNSGSMVVDTFVLQNDFIYQDTISFEFNETADFSGLGDYNFYVYIDYYADGNEANDTAVGILTHYEPVVDLGADTIVTTQPDTIVLDAGAGFDSYLWNDGSTNQTLNVTCADTCVYYVTAIDSNGCEASDTVVVIKELVYDIAVIEPENGAHYYDCGFTATDTVEILIQNVGGLDIPSGDTIIAGYQLNSGSWVVDTFELTQPLNVGDVMSLVFEETADLSAIGDYDYVVFANYYQDAVSANDTVSGVLTHYELTVDLGPDTIWTDQPDTIVLDAGAGYDTYLWNDGSTNQTLAVDTFGTFYVTVEDTNGCSASDTVVVAYAVSNSYAVLGDVRIYPNPTSGIFYIEVPNNSGDVELTISDITGKVVVRNVVRTSKVSIDLSKYNKGLYFVKLVSGNDVEVYKVIVK